MNQLTHYDNATFTPNSGDVHSEGFKGHKEAHVQVTTTEKDVRISNPKKVNASVNSCLKAGTKSL